MKAFIGIRDEPHYRRDAFASGLKAAGHSVTMGAPHNIDADTLYVAWNRYQPNHDICNKVERAGGKTLICENGYLGKDENGHQYYAIALRGHNGSGSWPVGDGSRFAALNIELQPWRTEGTHILVCGQRGIGSPTMASPPNWHSDVARRLCKLTKRPIRIRMHPGNHAPKIPLADDLRDCHAAVIWSSGSGVQALVAGIPVLFDAPHWICQGAAGRIDQAESPPMPDRLPAFERLAWSQWSLTEVASGEPFSSLLCRTSQEKIARCA